MDAVKFEVRLTKVENKQDWVEVWFVIAGTKDLRGEMYKDITGMTSIYRYEHLRRLPSERTIRKRVARRAKGVLRAKLAEQINPLGYMVYQINKDPIIIRVKRI